jgi:hypothetical protein
MTLLGPSCSDKFSGEILNLSNFMREWSVDLDLPDLDCPTQKIVCKLICGSRRILETEFVYFFCVLCAQGFLRRLYRVRKSGLASMASAGSDVLWRALHSREMTSSWLLSTIPSSAPTTWLVTCNLHNLRSLHFTLHLRHNQTL